MELEKFNPSYAKHPDQQQGNKIFIRVLKYQLLRNFCHHKKVTFLFSLRGQTEARLPRAKKDILQGLRKDRQTGIEFESFNSLKDDIEVF